MSYSFSARKSGDYILLVAHGTINSFHEYKEFHLAARKEVGAYGVRKSLRDMRGVNVQGVSPQEVEMLVNSILSALSPAEWMPVAALYNPDNDHFGKVVEAVTAKYSLPYKCFTDFNKARDWIENLDS